MGYRSDWQLVIAGHPLRLCKFMEWARAEAAKQKENLKTNEWSALAEILESSDEIQEDIEGGRVQFIGYGWKCYMEFESAIHTLRSAAVDDFELETGYARIGEEYTDLEVESDGDMYMSIGRTIEGPDNLPQPKEEDIQEYKDYLESKKGNVPPDKARWEDIANE